MLADRTWMMCFSIDDPENQTPQLALHVVPISWKHTQKYANIRHYICNYIYTYQSIFTTRKRFDFMWLKNKSKSNTGLQIFYFHPLYKRIIFSRPNLESKFGLPKIYPLPLSCGTLPAPPSVIGTTAARNAIDIRIPFLLNVLSEPYLL